MNRRSAIRSVMLISAGAAILPACAGNEKSLIPLKNISLTGSQERVLAALTESILPKTPSFIGASDLKAHEFVLSMIDDCTSPEDQKKFADGQKAFDELTRKKYGELFSECSTAQRAELLKSIENKTDIPEEVAAFYNTVKRYTVQSFTSSKEYMTQVRKYQMVPGSNFKGCVPVNS